MWSVIRRGVRGLSFMVGLIYNRRGKFKLLGLQGDPQIPSFSGTSYLSTRKTLRRVLVLLTVMILKGVSESISFHSSKFTASKIKEENEVANSLMAFNIPKIIHSFQDKKHLRT